jgi:hypothetical protein
MSCKARVTELFRDVANLAIRFDPLMREAFYASERIYVTCSDTLSLIPARYHDKCVVQLAVGTAQSYAASTSDGCWNGKGWGLPCLPWRA